MLLRRTHSCSYELLSLCDWCEFPSRFSRDVAVAIFAGQLTTPLLTVVIAVMSCHRQGALATGSDLVESQNSSDLSSRVLV